MLQKTVSVCILIAIVALVFRAGDFSIDARDFYPGSAERVENCAAAELTQHGAFG